MLSQGSGAGAKRSGGERSEPQRSGAPVPTEAPPAASHPDPEVVARPQRRSYTAEYKVRILREAEAAAAIRGGIGALLRREGLYSSLLVNWRRERAHVVNAFALPSNEANPRHQKSAEGFAQSVLSAIKHWPMPVALTDSYPFLADPRNVSCAVA